MISENESAVQIIVDMLGSHSFDDYHEVCICGWKPEWDLLRYRMPLDYAYADRHIADAILTALVGFALRSAEPAAAE